MSEYQYYEFAALDRRLGAKEMAEVRKFSSRADVMPTSFVNEYDWGDFRGRPEEFLTRWFDAMVYLANWGTRRFMLRLPAALIDAETLKACCKRPVAEVRPAGDGVIVDFRV